MGTRPPDSGNGAGSPPDGKDPSPGAAVVFLSASGFVLLWNSGFIGAEYVLPNVKPLRPASFTSVLP